MFKHLGQALLTFSFGCLLALHVSAGEDHHHDQGHEHEHRQHGAHVHGAAQLTVAQEGTQVLLELESPAANIFGFEHPPSDAQQRTVVREAVAALEEGCKELA